jgi:acetoin:2,6-dichlorophenolindophenol oxidoreductase subunit alpha
VPAGLPLACGAALSVKVRKTDQVAVAFFGDGGSNAGGFHESLNLAAVLKLPVVFVLENNGYADATSIRYAALIENLAERAQSYGIPGMTIDGSDVFAVFDAAGAAVTNARHHKRPMLLECKTYRYHGHYIGDLAPYRSREEVEQERKRDCIAGFERKVRGHGWLSDDTLSQIKTDSIEQVRDAVRFAEESPCPKPDECLDDVYVSY